MKLNQKAIVRNAGAPHNGDAFPNSGSIVENSSAKHGDYFIYWP